MDHADQNIGPCILWKIHLSTSFLVKIGCFFIDLSVNYYQTVPKFHFLNQYFDEKPSGFDIN
jgi:hypothetical protein